MQNDVLFYVLTISFLIACSGFFSAAETALTAISRARIYQLVMDGNKRAQVVSRLRREKESLIGAVLLGNNAINIAASTLATSFSIRIFGDNEAGLALVTVVMTLLVVVFAEILPKSYAIQNAEPVSLALATPLRFFVRLFYPITATIQAFIRVLLKCFGIDITKANTLISATDVIRGTIELHHREGNMIKQDRDMLGSILDLNDIEVQQIMIHRKQVETLDASMPPQALVEKAVSTMHSRIPLWRDEPDNIIGVLHVKDLIRLLNEIDYKNGGKLTSEAILAICSKPWFIPETTDLRSQLLAFRNKRRHFAFVVDEYGGWKGVVTLEDIIEEIVGNIEDEHDETGNDVQKTGDNSYSVAGSVAVRDLNRQLDWDLPDEHASTIAGLVIHIAETIPAVGESFESDGYRFTVLSKDARQLTRVRAEKLVTASEPDAEL